MSINDQLIKQQLLLQIERLPEYKLQEVLNFVETLLFKDKPYVDQTPTPPQSQQQILTGLSVIRETVQQNYGVYQGDLVAESRDERTEQVNLILDQDGDHANRH